MVEKRPLILSKYATIMNVYDVGFREDHMTNQNLVESSLHFRKIFHGRATYYLKRHCKNFLSAATFKK